jgi:hypothetical protein
MVGSSYYQKAMRIYALLKRPAKPTYHSNNRQPGPEPAYIQKTRPGKGRDRSFAAAEKGSENIDLLILSLSFLLKRNSISRR